MAKRAQITPELEAFFESSAVIWVASADDEGNPESTRGVGYQVRDQGHALVVFLPTEQSGHTLQNLHKNPELAIFFASVTEYRAVQIKGAVVAVRDTRAAERKLQETFRQRFVEQAVKLGMAQAVVSRLTCSPSTAVEIAVRELYVQTPGPQAGTPCQ